tara:strand:+ start:321 stop:764 length:444 start_codon:yes stop_codon:yes gene_type:complete
MTNSFYNSTKEHGDFKLKDLEPGHYRFQVHINRLLQIDTTIYLTDKKTELTLVLDDRKFWNYIDSTQLAKYPYNAEAAKSDIEKGIILILSAGYQLFSHDELDTLTDKYGFKYEVVGGCVVNRWQQLAMDHYNEVVYQYQSQYFGLA